VNLQLASEADKRRRRKLLGDLIAFSLASDRLNLDSCKAAALLARESVRGGLSVPSTIERISDSCGMTKAEVADRIAIGEAILKRRQ
jgi:hypothetical protein